MESPIQKNSKNTKNQQMKIYTITCHDVYNYGASLQAYALQHYLESRGHEVEIIDYLPQYMDKSYKIRWNSYVLPPASKLYRFKGKIPFVDTLFKISELRRHVLFICSKWGRKKTFDNFKHSYLKLTDQHFETFDELQKANLKADAFIAGSDQIWNTAFQNGRDASFFLEFAGGKRISYAASFGLSKLEDIDKKRIKEQLGKFSSISVREKTGLTILDDLGIKNAIQVLDPVFLLDKKQWLEVASHKYDLKNYLLVYNLNSLNTEIKRCAQAVAKEKNLKIVSVEEYGKITYADVRITDAGPSEFVELFSKASFVVTNSFHATAFSLLFNVPFFSIIKNKTASRINDVLEMVDLKDRMNPETVSEVAPICWTRVNDCLSRNRNKSVDFLGNSLL